ncbi:hypothetical protein AX16_002059 [Volvariella volvacea WC 439]|nr:hypothetical protein AX16_002059 [Volvariella volvacea WC 439]
MVSCDFNATDAPQDVDIFTLARDKGAGAALLYSLYSQGCIINPEYADPATFDQVFDIFSTQNRISAGLIEAQFQESSFDQSIYGQYDSALLNNSAAQIAASQQTLRVDSPGFMFAILQASNATASLPTPAGGNSTVGASATAGNGSSPNTALAMIILYAITGCVSALFCIVIISGAIRAIRHPERYGPRTQFNEDGMMVQQSRARGLARAVLDTFPIVKFGSNTQDAAIPRHKDPENQRDSDVSRPQVVELRDVATSANVAAAGDQAGTTMGSSSGAAGGSGAAEGSARRVDDSAEQPSSSRGAGASTSRENDEAAQPPPRPSQSNVDSTRQTRTDVQPESMGRETCPICIVDFEEGDDLRQLPCEGKHRFHQQCVDPWLLELSSSCPLCRQDFLALENMLSGSTENHDGNADHPPLRQSQHLTNRFSRYLRFAHRRARRGDEPDPTDPYMPTAPETSMYSGL